MLYQQATTWRERPASLVGMPGGSWARYDFDSAVWYFGRFVEGELDKIKLTENQRKKANANDVLADKRKNRLEALIMPDKKQRVATVDDLRAMGIPVVSR